MTWIKHLDNPEAISRLYDSSEGLDKVDICEILLRCDIPRLALRADLPRFPDHPSKRWDKEANRALVEVHFFGVRDFQIQGFCKENPGVLTVQPEGELYRFAFQGEGVSLSGTCWSYRLAHVSAYHDYIKTYYFGE